MEVKKETRNLTRAFIAVEFSDEVIKEIARVQELVEKWQFTGKMTELENVHLSLKFLGEIDDGKLDKVKGALKEIRMTKFKMRLGQIGIFHFNKHPRIIWIKMLGKEVYELQKKVDEKLAEIGFQKEERFMGHATIARIKHVADEKGFEERLKSIKCTEIEFEISKLLLKSSELRSSGPIYKDIETINLE